MGGKSKGYRSRTRHMFKKKLGERGRLPLAQYLRPVKVCSYTSIYYMYSFLNQSSSNIVVGNSYLHVTKKYITTTIQQHHDVAYRY